MKDAPKTMFIHTKKIILLLIALLILLQSPIFADFLNPGTGQQKIVTIETVLPTDKVHPDQLTALAIIIRIKNGFHINADKKQIVSFKQFKPLRKELTMRRNP